MPVFLKKVELFGFKSFADRSKIEFNSPVTAIIGPNGSGKSNIIDAIRWVLGESSSKALRGNTFEDIIFAGSQYRPSLSVAEVSLLFDNTTRILPIPIDEVEILKRYYRSGEGKILINKQEVRVKDVVNLFLGTGFGKEGFSIIGQGEIEKLVVGTPQEKRDYVDELLGLSKVKFKKKEAEKRLLEVNSNLTTLIARFESIEKDYNRLKIELEKLNIYRKLSEKLEHLEKLLSLLKVIHYQQELTPLLLEREAIEKEIKSLNDKLQEFTNSLSYLDTLLQEENNLLSIKREELNEVEKLIKSKELEKKSLETKIEMSKRTIDIYTSSITKELQRKEELEKEKLLLLETIEKLSNEATEIQHHTHELKETIKNTETEKGELENQKEKLLSKVESIKTIISKIDTLSKETNWLYSKKEELIKSKAELSTLIQEIEKSLNETKAERDRIVLEIENLRQEADTISPELSRKLLNIKTLEDKANEIQTLISNLSKQSERMFQEFSNNISSSAIKIGEFISQVDLTSQQITNICEIILSQKLEQQEIKIKVEEIKQLSTTLYEKIKTLPYLSTATEFISKKIEIDENILSLRKSFEEIQEKIYVQKDEISELREKQKRTEIILSTKEQELTKNEKLIESLQKELKDKLQKLESLDKDLKQILSDIQSLQLDSANILTKLSNLDIDSSNTPSEEKTTEPDLSQLKPYLEEKLKALSLKEIEEKIKEKDILISHKRSELLQLETKNTIIHSDIKSSRERIRKIEEETEKIKEFTTAKQKDILTEEENIKNYQILLENLTLTLEELSNQRDNLLKVVSEKSLNIKELNQKYRETTNKKEEISKKVSQLEKQLLLTEEKIKSLQNNIETTNLQLAEKYGLTIKEIENLFSQEELGKSLEEITKETLTLKNKIRGIGFINENAEKEFKEVEKEYLSLKASLEDILQSKQKLEEMINNINSEIEKIVSNSLEDISRIITDVFREIFGGGGVRIEIDKNDLIEGGIELSVNIPGKKVRNLLLLSGGEKALVGIIFVFSALMITNTPIVILDEVDASLDDENTERFKRLILSFKDKTQFIIVSHNKSTIELCQDIYGVTMEEKGVSKVVSYRLQDLAV
ncbi:MAG: AAA family ATPase [Brevinematia bacterium]